MFGHELKACRNSKGAGKFVRKLSSSCINLSEDWLTNELKSLSFNSRENNIAMVNINVNSLLSSPKFWVHCYENIESNSNIFIDEIDLEYFNLLAKKIKSGRFIFGPVKKVMMTKLDESNFSSNIVHSYDKIVQKGIVIILEQVSDHKFSDSSFGFRKGKSVHDAISYIRQKVPYGMWAIKGNISQCFDNFDFKRLVSLIRKKYVDHQIFSDLLYKALKSKIISVESSFINKTKTPESFVVSSILLNIYLNEFDLFVLKDNSLKKYRFNKKKVVNSTFTKFLKLKNHEILEAESVKTLKGKKKYWSFLQKLRVSKLKEATKRKIFCFKFNGLNRKIVYVRYADDFIVFVWGTKNDCLEIKKLIKNFLNSQLALNLSKEKTKITYLKKNKVEFLGFNLWQFSSKIPSLKKNVNSTKIFDREGTNLNYGTVMLRITPLRITFSISSVLIKLVDKGLVRYKNGKFFPTSYKPALQYDIKNIILYMRAVFIDLTNYYSYCHNWYDAKILYNYFGKYCVAMTIAHKTKSKISKVFAKYGNELSVIDVEGKITISYGSLSNAIIKRKSTNNFFNYDGVLSVENLFFKHLKLGKVQVTHKPCVICGKPAEMHYIKHVIQVLKKKSFTIFNVYFKIMRFVNRKTILICKEHHLQICNGNYDKVFLKKLFEILKSKSIGFNELKIKRLIEKSSSKIEAK
jgi:retron-type reverse transcriptase